MYLLTQTFSTKGIVGWTLSPWLLVLPSDHCHGSCNTLSPIQFITLKGMIPQLKNSNLKLHLLCNHSGHHSIFQFYSGHSYITSLSFFLLTMWTPTITYNNPINSMNLCSSSKGIGGFSFILSALLTTLTHFLCFRSVCLLYFSAVLRMLASASSERKRYTRGKK